MTDPDSLSILFQELVAVVSKLRDPDGGCPWDLEQTHASLKPHLIEEAYEVIDAIDGDRTKLPEELGDLLLQVVLHAQIGKDEKTFTISDVICEIKNKMIERHPHVFGSTKVSDSTQVLKNWEQSKSEKANLAGKSTMDSIPRQLPALLKAQRIGERAARIGFDWISSEDVLTKVTEEVAEFTTAKTTDNRKEELGDLLFALVQYGRKLNIDVEESLQQANSKFIGRFKKMEVKAAGKMSKLSLAQLETLWQEIKSE